MRTKNKSEKWQIVRGLILVLRGMWMSVLGASELWIKVSGGRMDNLVSVN